MPHPFTSLAYRYSLAPFTYMPTRILIQYLPSFWAREGDKYRFGMGNNIEPEAGRKDTLPKSDVESKAFPADPSRPTLVLPFPLIATGKFDLIWMIRETVIGGVGLRRQEDVESWSWKEPVFIRLSNPILDGKLRFSAIERQRTNSLNQPSCINSDNEDLPTSKCTLLSLHHSIPIPSSGKIIWYRDFLFRSCRFALFFFIN